MADVYLTITRYLTPQASPAMYRNLHNMKPRTLTHQIAQRLDRMTDRVRWIPTGTGQFTGRTRPRLRTISRPVPGSKQAKAPTARQTSSACRVDISVSVSTPAPRDAAVGTLPRDPETPSRGALAEAIPAAAAAAGTSKQSPVMNTPGRLLHTYRSRAGLCLFPGGFGEGGVCLIPAWKPRDHRHSQQALWSERQIWN